MKILLATLATVLLLGCSADNKEFTDSLKIGNEFHPELYMMCAVHEATEEMQTYAIVRNTLDDSQVFVTVKQGKIVSVWRRR